MFPSDRHRPFVVPEDEVRRRLDGLQQGLLDEGIAVAWVEHLADRIYYSGSAQDGVLLVPAEGEPRFFVRKSVERASGESPVTVEPYPGGKALAQRVAGQRLGAALDVTPAATVMRLDADVVDLSNRIRQQRSVKSAWEIDQIRRASDQVTSLFREAPEKIVPGMTELELTGWVEGRVRALGHGGTIRVRRPAADLAMGVVVSGDASLYATNFNGPVGSEGAYPPAASGAGWKALVAGEAVMLDIVTSHNGYHADTTRAYFLGDAVPERARAAHDRCTDLLQFTESMMRPGAVCSEIYRRAQGRIDDRGAPEGFMWSGANAVRFLGHGVGLELDELPVLANKVDLVLEPGNVIAVEPKAFLAGIGPVGVENTYVITDEGCQPLCPIDTALHRVG